MFTISGHRENPSLLKNLKCLWINSFWSLYKGIPKHCHILVLNQWTKKKICIYLFTSTFDSIYNSNKFTTWNKQNKISLTKKNKPLRWCINKYLVLGCPLELSSHSHVVYNKVAKDHFICLEDFFAVTWHASEINMYPTPAKNKG